MNPPHNQHPHHKQQTRFYLIKINSLKAPTNYLVNKDKTNCESKSNSTKLNHKKSQKNPTTNNFLTVSNKKKSKVQTSLENNQIQQYPNHKQRKSNTSKTKEQNILLSKNQQQQKKISKQPEQLKQKSTEYKISFTAGSYTSSAKSTIFQYQKQSFDKAQQDQRIKNKKKLLLAESHIFPFQKEELMTILVENEQNKKQYGYGMLPLIPFLEMPDTKHSVEIQLVMMNQRRQIVKQKTKQSSKNNHHKPLTPILNITLYFLDDFKGRLLIQPLHAEIIRNVAQLGQMNPKIKIISKGQQYETEEIAQGGIRPNWKNNQNHYCFFNIPFTSVSSIFQVQLYEAGLTQKQQIGSYSVSLQAQKIFNQGISLKDFILEQTHEISKNNVKNNQKKINKTTTFKEQQQNKFLGLNKQQKLIALTNQKRKALQLYQLGWIAQRAQFYRPRLIKYMIHNVKTIASKFPLEILEQLIDKICQEYHLQENRIQENFLLHFRQNLQQFNNDEIEQLNDKSRSTLSKSDLRYKTRQYLLKQIQNFVRFAEQNMEQGKIPLYSKNFDDKVWESTQKQVGVLHISYLFLFDFEYSEYQEQYFESKQYNDPELHLNQFSNHLDSQNNLEGQPLLSQTKKNNVATYLQQAPKWYNNQK